MASRDPLPTSSLRLTAFLYLTFCWSLVQCTPIPTSVRRTSDTQVPFQQPSSALFHVGPTVATAFLWTSIGLAVVTAIAQGLVSALAYMTEASNMWTFRFRIAKGEHIWWSVVTVLLTMSLSLDILSFASGYSNTAVTVLLISSTTLLTLVRYMLPAWRSRRFILNRWCAWAGPSRTAIPRTVTAYCGNAGDWKYVGSKTDVSKGKPVHSDDYGWHLLPVKRMRHDPTDILKAVNTDLLLPLSGDDGFVFDDGYPDHEMASLFWGAHSGFLPRVCRAVSSVPTHLLKSQPITAEGYAGEGLCLGIGILGRNKGLKPEELVFRMDRSIAAMLENRSAWRPRPAKTLRSYYQKVLNDMYGQLGQMFVAAAIELCLLLMDADEHAAYEWLKAGCEHQSYRTNKMLRDLGATPAELRAHYRSSYVSMIISLNNMEDAQLGHGNHGRSQAKRPDMICLALLLKAEGAAKPLWWGRAEISTLIGHEKLHLDGNWYESAARLLGLHSFPVGLEDGFWCPEDRNSAQSQVAEAEPQKEASEPSTSLKVSIGD